MWGGVCEFDERRFREVVVPALRAGEHHPVVRRAVELMFDSAREERCRFEGLAEVVTLVGESFTDCALGRDFDVGWTYWDLVTLFEWVVTRETVVSFANLGSAGRNIWYLYRELDEPTYFRDHPAGTPQPRLQALLTRLDLGKGPEPCYWQSGATGEGICGWLDAGQTRELAEVMPAPDTGVESFVRDRRHRFQAVRDRAVRHGNGLLWGRGLSLFHGESRAMFADGEPHPIEIRYPYRDRQGPS